MAFESDPLIFEAVLAPLRDVVPSASVVMPPINAAIFDGDDVPIRHVAKRNRLST